jgi:hypothetical protein
MCQPTHAEDTTAQDPRQAKPVNVSSSRFWASRLGLLWELLSKGLTFSPSRREEWAADAKAKTRATATNVGRKT